MSESSTSFHIKALSTLIPIKKEQKATYEILIELEEQISYIYCRIFTLKN